MASKIRRSNMKRHISNEEQKADIPKEDEDNGNEDDFIDPWPSTTSVHPSMESQAEQYRMTMEAFNNNLVGAAMSLMENEVDAAEQGFVDALRLIYRQADNSDQVKQVFTGLAKIYVKRAKKDNDLEALVNAVGLFNGALRRTVHDTEREDIVLDLEGLDAMALKIILNSPVPVPGTDHADDMKNKAHLDGLRTKYRQDMIKIGSLENGIHRIDKEGTGHFESEGKFVESVEQLYAGIAQDMKAFLETILKQSIRKIGPVPCAFALISLGSLARQEMTPYSDYEFAFLIKEDTEANRQYFRNLTRYMHIRVLNLQETLIPCLGLKYLNDTHNESKKDNWFFEEGPRGISFDGAFSFASKTPIGRKPTKKKSWVTEFIGSPEVIAKFQEQDSILKEGYHVADVLRKVVFVAGEASLVKMYQEEVKAKLEVKINTPGEDDKVILTDIQKETKQNLRKDADRFALRSGINNEGVLWNVKKEIYRLTNIIVDSAATLYNIQTTSSWDTISKMKAMKLLNEQAAHNMSLAHSIGTWLRLKTYMNNKSQIENLSVLPPRGASKSQDPDEGSFVKIFHVKNRGLIMRFMQISGPLAESAKEVATRKGPLSPFVSPSNCLCDMSLYSKAMSLIHLMQYKEAENVLQNYVKERKNRADCGEDVPLYCVYWRLGYVSEALNHFDKSDLYYKTALEGSRVSHPCDPKQTSLIAMLINSAQEYRRKAEYDRALRHLREAEDVANSWTAEDRIKYASITKRVSRDLGLLLCDMGNLQDGVKILESALQDERQYQSQGETSVELTGLLSSAGAAHLQLGNFEKAEEYITESLNMAVELYGVGVAHPHISELLNNLGILYIYTGELEAAIVTLEENVSMTEHIYGRNTIHKDVISSLYNLANAYFQVSLIPLALSSYKKLLRLRRCLLGPDARHPSIAGNINNIGSCHSKLQEFTKAIFYYCMALEMRKQIHGEDADHFDIADSHFNLGCAYFESERLQEAVVHYKKALGMFKKVLGEESRHPYICETHENLKRLYEMLGDEERSKVHGDEISKLLKGEDSPNDEEFEENDTDTNGDDDEENELKKAIAFSLMQTTG